MRQPDIAADHTVVPDKGLPAENRRTGINDHALSDIRMALDALDGIAVFIGIKAFGAKRYALIQLDMAADYRGFPDDNARAVVDEKVGTDFCPRMNINRRCTVRIFRHDTRQHRHAAFV